MCVLALLFRKPLGAGFVLVVPHNLAHPFAPGDVVAEAAQRFTVVGVEAGNGPREVQLLVKPAE